MRSTLISLYLMKLHSCWWCYRAISDTHPGLNYLGLDMPLPIAYGSNTPILSSIVVIVDAGTTLVLLATDAFEAYETVTAQFFRRTPGASPMLTCIASSTSPASYSNR